MRGKLALLGVLLFAPVMNSGHAQVCSNSSVGLPPINDLGTDFYRTRQGGLYPLGQNTRPADHNNAGLSIAQTTVPLDTNGLPDNVNGKVVLISIGMSNAKEEFGAFQTLVDSITEKSPYLVVVNGAQGGKDIDHILNPLDSFWIDMHDSLAMFGVTAKQVQAFWFKEAEQYPQDGNDTSFFGYVPLLTDKFRQAMHIARSYFPNGRLCYLSSRIYAGYATDRLNPEPFAWYSGWTVKDLVAEQIAGDTSLTYADDNPRSPWLSWGPYLWADGLTPRSDSLTWVCPDDYKDDGDHPSIVGREKVANMILDFFMNDETTIPWFIDGITLDVNRPHGDGLPVSFRVRSYPNPFNPSTNIQFELPAAEHVTLRIYNLLGQELATLIDEEKTAGTYTTQFNAPGTASGIYVYQLNAGSRTATGKLVLMK